MTEKYGDAPETTEKAYWKKIPMSVLLAICSSLNKSSAAQLRAAEMQVEITDQVRVQLLALAAAHQDPDVKAWIYRELEAHND